METYKLTNGKTLEITQDDYPRHDENLSTMICFHGRYNLGDKHVYSDKDYLGWAEMETAIIKNEKPAIILPLYLYDHSGITISTSPFSCRWDSGQIGFVIVTKDKIKSNWNIKKVTKKDIDRAMKVLLAEVDTYDNYIRGEVYGYIDKTQQKFESVFNLLVNLKQSYDTSTEYQKEFLSTIVGAAIYYLPTNKLTFSGKISERALGLPKNKRVKEHEYPRKIVGKTLLDTIPNSVDELKTIYLTKYGIWNLVTKEENTRLRKYQKEGVFVSPEISYQLAEIILTNL